MTELDHLVYAVPDLDEAIDRFDRALGVRPVIGGHHDGLGTWNALVRLDGPTQSSYLELIAADPDQDDPGVPRPFGIDDDPGPRLVTFAVRPAAGETLEEVADLMRGHGHDPGPPVAMSRSTPDGTVLRWRLTLPTPDGFVPFLIEWGDTPNPATTIEPGVELELVGGTPPPEVRSLLDALRPAGFDLGRGSDRSRGSDLGAHRTTTAATEPLTAVLRCGDRILRL